MDDVEAAVAARRRGAQRGDHRVVEDRAHRRSGSRSRSRPGTRSRWSRSASRHFGLMSQPTTRPPRRAALSRLKPWPKPMSRNDAPASSTPASSAANSCLRAIDALARQRDARELAPVLPEVELHAAGIRHGGPPDDTFGILRRPTNTNDEADSTNALPAAPATQPRRWKQPRRARERNREEREDGEQITPLRLEVIEPRVIERERDHAAAEDRGDDEQLPARAGRRAGGSRRRPQPSRTQVEHEDRDVVGRGAVDLHVAVVAGEGLLRLHRPTPGLDQQLVAARRPCRAAAGRRRSPALRRSRTAGTRAPRAARRWRRGRPPFPSPLPFTTRS